MKCSGCGRTIPPKALRAAVSKKAPLRCSGCGTVTPTPTALGAALSSDPDFDGPVYDPATDKGRLTRQIGRVFDCMKGGAWRTLDEIAGKTGDPHASVSAQLRHLRKPRFGGYTVEKRHRGAKTDGLWEYQLV